MRGRERDRRTTERGAGLVEFALVLPLLVSLLLGIVTGGQAYHRKITITDAMREGARFGATLEGVASDTTWASTVRARTVDRSSGELTSSQVCVKVVKVGSSTPVAATPGCSFAEPTTPSGAASGSCVVKVWGERTSKLEAMFFTTDLTLEANGVGRYERDC